MKTFVIDLILVFSSDLSLDADGSLTVEFVDEFPSKDIEQQKV